MAVYTIPLEDAAELGAFTFTVDLDGVDFQFAFQFCSREEFWYFDLQSPDGSTLRAGIKVVSNFPLLRLYRDVVSRPAGEVMSINTLLNPTDPGLSDLDVSSVFGYLDQSELTG